MVRPRNITKQPIKRDKRRGLMQTMRPKTIETIPAKIVQTQVGTPSLRRVGAPTTSDKPKTVMPIPIIQGKIEANIVGSEKINKAMTTVITPKTRVIIVVPS